MHPVIVLVLHNFWGKHGALEISMCVVIGNCYNAAT